VLPPTESQNFYFLAGLLHRYISSVQGGGGKES
jgi:hypothetical protein